MTKFDPYEVLGVDRDATEDEIKRAAKDHVRKVHPDAGGNEDAFIENRRALMILMDPKKRKRFDRTGDAAEEEPDNAGANAMQIIHTEISQISNAFLMAGFDPTKDPRRMDLIKVVRTNIAKRISDAREVLRNGRFHAAFLQDFAKRFKMTRKNDSAFNFIVRQINDEIRSVDTQIEDVERMIADANLALTLLESYSFKFDPVQTPSSYGFDWSSSPSVRYP